MVTFISMPIYTTHVDFPVNDYPTLRFMEHCFDNWRETEICTEAHVSFMKHLVRSIFGLPHTTPLVGIRFEDNTLAMISPPRYDVFFLLTRNGNVWRSQRVRVEGFPAQWGLESGFWDGLRMAECVLMGEESVGPMEDESITIH